MRRASLERIECVWSLGGRSWIGRFATEFTGVGRWIMHSIVTGDRRAVSLCAGWLQQGTDSEQQSQALR